MTKEKKTSALPSPFTSLENLFSIVLYVKALVNFLKIKPTILTDFNEVILSVESYLSFRYLLHITANKTVWI